MYWNPVSIFILQFVIYVAKAQDQDPHLEFLSGDNGDDFIQPFRVQPSAETSGREEESEIRPTPASGIDEPRSPEALYLYNGKPVVTVTATRIGTARYFQADTPAQMTTSHAATPTSAETLDSSSLAPASPSNEPLSQGTTEGSFGTLSAEAVLAEAGPTLGSNEIVPELSGADHSQETQPKSKGLLYVPSWDSSAEASPSSEGATEVLNSMFLGTKLEGMSSGEPGLRLEGPSSMEDSTLNLTQDPTQAPFPTGPDSSSTTEPNTSSMDDGGIESTTRRSGDGITTALADEPNEIVEQLPSPVALISDTTEPSHSRPPDQPIRLEDEFAEAFTKQAHPGSRRRLRPGPGTRRKVRMRVRKLSSSSPPGEEGSETPNEPNSTTLQGPKRYRSTTTPVPDPSPPTVHTNELFENDPKLAIVVKQGPEPLILKAVEPEYEAVTPQPQLKRRRPTSTPPSVDGVNTYYVQSQVYTSTPKPSPPAFSTNDSSKEWLHSETSRHHDVHHAEEPFVHERDNWEKNYMNLQQNSFYGASPEDLGGEGQTLTSLNRKSKAGRREAARPPIHTNPSILMLTAEESHETPPHHHHPFGLREHGPDRNGLIDITTSEPERGFEEIRVQGPAQDFQEIRIQGPDQGYEEIRVQQGPGQGFELNRDQGPHHDNAMEPDPTHFHISEVEPGLQVVLTRSEEGQGVFYPGSGPQAQNEVFDDPPRRSHYDRTKHRASQLSNGEVVFNGEVRPTAQEPHSEHPAQDFNEPRRGENFNGRMNQEDFNGQQTENFKVPQTPNLNGLRHEENFSDPRHEIFNGQPTPNFNGPQHDQNANALRNHENLHGQGAPNLNEPQHENGVNPTRNHENFNGQPKPDFNGPRYEENVNRAQNQGNFNVPRHLDNFNGPRHEEKPTGPPHQGLQNFQPFQSHEFMGFGLDQHFHPEKLLTKKIPGPEAYLEKRGRRKSKGDEKGPEPFRPSQIIPFNTQNNNLLPAPQNYNFGEMGKFNPDPTANEREGFPMGSNGNLSPGRAPFVPFPKQLQSMVERGPLGPGQRGILPYEGKAPNLGPPPGGRGGNGPSHMPPQFSGHPHRGGSPFNMNPDRREGHDPLKVGDFSKGHGVGESPTSSITLPMPGLVSIPTPPPEAFALNEIYSNRHYPPHTHSISTNPDYEPANPPLPNGHPLQYHFDPFLQNAGQYKEGPKVGATGQKLKGKHLTQFQNFKEPSQTHPSYNPYQGSPAEDTSEFQDFPPPAPSKNKQKKAAPKPSTVIHHYYDSNNKYMSSVEKEHEPETQTYTTSPEVNGESEEEYNISPVPGRGKATKSPPVYAVSESKERGSRASYHGYTPNQFTRPQPKPQPPPKQIYSDNAYVLMFPNMVPEEAMLPPKPLINGKEIPVISATASEMVETTHGGVMAPGFHAVKVHPREQMLQVLASNHYDMEMEKYMEKKRRPPLPIHTPYGILIPMGTGSSTNPYNDITGPSSGGHGLSVGINGHGPFGKVNVHKSIGLQNGKLRGMGGIKASPSVEPALELLAEKLAYKLGAEGVYSDYVIHSPPQDYTYQNHDTSYSEHSPVSIKSSSKAGKKSKSKSSKSTTPAPAKSDNTAELKSALKSLVKERLYEMLDEAEADEEEVTTVGPKTKPPTGRQKSKTRGRELHGSSSMMTPSILAPPRLRPITPQHQNQMRSSPPQLQNQMRPSPEPGFFQSIRRFFSFGRGQEVPKPPRQQHPAFNMTRGNRGGPGPNQVLKKQGSPYEPSKEEEPESEAQDEDEEGRGKSMKEIQRMLSLLFKAVEGKSKGSTEAGGTSKSSSEAEGKPEPRGPAYFTPSKSTEETGWVPLSSKRGNKGKLKNPNSLFSGGEEEWKLLQAQLQELGKNKLRNKNKLSSKGNKDMSNPPGKDSILFTFA